MERSKIILIMPSYELENLKKYYTKIQKISLLVLDDCSSDESEKWLSQKMALLEIMFAKDILEI